MRFAIEGIHGLGTGRRFGDGPVGRLQAFAALAFDDLFAQLAGARLDAVFQFFMRLLAHQGGQDVLRDITEQGAIFLAVAQAVVVGLHDDAATHLAAGQHRHAEPVDAVRAETLVACHAEFLAQRLRRAHHRPAMAQHRHGQAVLQVVKAELGVRIGVVVVVRVDEVDEAHAAARLVVTHDHEVLGVHQVADDLVDAGQHLGHFQVGRGKIGDGVQGALQTFGRFEPVQRTAQTLAINEFCDTPRQRQEMTPEGVGFDFDRQTRRVAVQQQFRTCEQMRPAQRHGDAGLRFLRIQRHGDAGFARAVVDQVTQVRRVRQGRCAAAMDVAAGAAADTPEQAQAADAEGFAETGAANLRDRVQAFAGEQAQGKSRKLPVALAVGIDGRRSFLRVR